MTSQRLIRLAPAFLWFAVLAIGYVLILTLNAPGHMSVDSVISLAEGRRGVRIVFGPPMYSSILGFFDRITPSSPFAYIAGASLLLVAAWAAMPGLRPRLAWIAPAVLAGAMLAPQVLLYQAIMWKDVLFANFAIAGFVTLAHAVKRWERPTPRLLLLFLSFLLLGMACLLRQNGALVAVFSAATLGWAAWKSGWRRAAMWAAAGFAGPLVFMAVLDAATPVKDPPGENRDVGLRLLQGYDLAGAIAADPDRPLRALEADNPAAAADLRRESPRYYSATRVDALLGSKTLGRAINSYSDGVIAEQWVQTLSEDPLGYATRRLDVFRWVFATPDIDQCLPVHLGVDGPPKLMQELGVKRRQDADDRRLWNYTTWWMDTPGLSHPAFAVLALAVTGFLLLRRERADIAMAGLMLSALSFAASFYVISLACDYRYLYFLDLAAITGLVYVALDPRLRRRSA
ncbi:hypothetical protein ACO2Q0_19925 [Phenylobacterium sp. VNQ135]|uniref:hypothetical protein n=1 Tax=Phenylobacterium sp. VNQ135 TaxID=3400922 RepID=UPI003BFE96A2